MFQCEGFRYQPAEKHSLRKALRDTMDDDVIQMCEIKRVYIKKVNIKIPWDEEILNRYLTENQKANYIWDFCDKAFKNFRRSHKDDKKDLYPRSCE